jgi:hypothetical protein
MNKLFDVSVVILRTMDMLDEKKRGKKNQVLKYIKKFTLTLFVSCMAASFSNGMLCKMILHLFSLQ